MTRLTPTRLRENLYKVLDQVLQTGRPIAVKRRGQLLTIVPPRPKNRLAALKKRKFIKGDPEGLVHRNWTPEWKPKFF